VEVNGSVFKRLKSFGHFLQHGLSSRYLPPPCTIHYNRSCRSPRQHLYIIFALLHFTLALYRGWASLLLLLEHFWGSCIIIIISIIRQHQLDRHHYHSRISQLKTRRKRGRKEGRRKRKRDGGVHSNVLVPPFLDHTNQPAPSFSLSCSSNGNFR
jgi:hypothetical protein